jgi:hypothetical protein
MDQTVTDDHPVSVGLLDFPEASIGFFRRNKGIYLFKSAFIKQDFYAFPGSQFAFGVLFIQGFGITLFIIFLLPFEETGKILSIHIHVSELSAYDMTP